jgi:hypothetical protein
MRLAWYSEVIGDVMVREATRFRAGQGAGR